MNAVKHPRLPLLWAPGFTVMELLVVMACLALLLSVAAPRFVGHLERAREVALKENLARTRLAIDQFYSDNGRYPIGLAELVQRRYLRALPTDPITERDDTWILLSEAQRAQWAAAAAGAAAGSMTGPGAGSALTPDSLLSPANASGAGSAAMTTATADLRSGARGNSLDGTPYVSW